MSDIVSDFLEQSGGRRFTAEEVARILRL